MADQLTAPAGPAGPGGDPGEALLAQIRQLLDQYLAMGQDTPVAAEAQQLAQAIDTKAPGAAGPAGPGGAADLYGGGGGAEAGIGAPPPTGGLGLEDLMAPQEGEPPRTTGKSSFKQARGNAEKRLKKRNEKK